jgi:hypothetical protein
MEDGRNQGFAPYAVYPIDSVPHQRADLEVGTPTGRILFPRTDRIVIYLEFGF